MNIVEYDVTNPPSSPILGRYTYQGPPLGPCGSPSISLVDAFGNSINFLTASFAANSNGQNGNSGDITISLPDKTTAVKGTYELTAIFTQPGSYSFSLGLDLKVFDICDSFNLESAPVLSPNNPSYQTG